MKPFFNSISNSNSPLRTHQAVPKVDHFNLPKSLQSLQSKTAEMWQLDMSVSEHPITSGMSSFPLQHGSTNPKVLMPTRLETTQNSCLKQLTSAMATAPFSVKVLSFKFITLSNGLIAKACASAVMPGWLIPFCGIWTSSKVPMIWEKM